MKQAVSVGEKLTIGKAGRGQLDVEPANGFSTVQSPASSDTSPIGAALAKLISLFVIFTVEILTLTIFFDSGSTTGTGGLLEFFRVWGADSLRAGLTFLTVYFIFASFSKTAPLRTVLQNLASARVSWISVGVHAVAFLALLAALNMLQQASPVLDAAALVLASVLTAGLAFVAGVMAISPAPLLASYLKSTFELAFAPAAISGIVTLLFEGVAKPVWHSASVLTFQVVGYLLKLVRSDVIVDPPNLTVGTSSFYVKIVAACSGLEGAALMLVFGGLWLWYFRAEHRFPIALLMLPLGVLAAWCLNAVRIAGLILIGDAGAERLAMGGFHSQAGWIAWNIVALGFVLVLHRSDALRKHPAGAAAATGVQNPSAWYLTPFLAILAAGIVAQAVSEHHQLLYPLRLAGAGLALWWFSRRYRELDWRMGWAALVGGLSVAILWLALDWAAGPQTSTLRAEVNTLPQPWMLAWIVARVIGNTIIIPISEELAFRGFLMRRIVSPDFRRVSPKTVGLLAIAISSIVFGVFHGDRYVAGTLAGVLYALAYRHNGRIGDAVGAHAVTNAVLSIMVLTRQDWHLW